MRTRMKGMGARREKVDSRRTLFGRRFLKRHTFTQRWRRWWDYMWFSITIVKFAPVLLLIREHKYDDCGVQK